MIDTRGRQIEKRRRWMITIIAVAGLSCAGFAMVRGLARSHDGTERDRAQSAADRDAPLRIEPVPPRVTIDAKRADAALERLKMARPPTLATALHVIRLFGGEIDAEAPDNQKHHRFNDLLFNHKIRTLFFGDRPALVETREGVRCRTGDVADRLAPRQTERQAHADQFLSVLAETGVPLSRTITTDHGPRDARAILADSLANFDPKGREIEWSALAFALYLPPRRSWRDKFGRAHTFDELTEELIARPFDGGLSCGGTHLLQSLTTLVRADQVEPVLSAEVRHGARSHLQEMVSRAVRAQRPDGSWDLHWHESLSVGEPAGKLKDDDSTNWTSVLVTGHLTEWMLMLPGDLQPGADVFLRAAQWLQERIKRADGPTIMANYCPYSHAARVLQILSRGKPEGPKTKELSQKGRGESRFCAGKWDCPPLPGRFEDGHQKSAWTAAGRRGRNRNTQCGRGPRPGPSWCPSPIQSVVPNGRGKAARREADRSEHGLQPLHRGEKAGFPVSCPVRGVGRRDGACSVSRDWRWF